MFIEYINEKAGFVLTYNPADAQSQLLADTIKKIYDHIYMSRVTGFGRPELRFGNNSHIRGVQDIHEFVKLYATYVAAKPTLEDFLAEYHKIHGDFYSCY